MALNYTGELSDLIKSMYDYSIVPSEKIKRRMDFYYTPYNSKFLLRKHMTFESEDENEQGQKESPGAGAADGNSKRQRKSRTPGVMDSNELEQKRRDDLYKMVKAMISSQS